MKKLNWIIFTTFILVSVFFPVSQNMGQININRAIAAEEIQSGEFGDLESASGELCGFGFSGEISWCFGYILYMVAVNVTSWGAAMAGKFLDFFLDLSLQSSTYGNGFITEGWKILRDIANLSFIFILLYVAIRTIFGDGGAKKTIITVVIMALLLNFSLFFCRVIIDASNILA